jgi:hypothetical protein
MKMLDLAPNISKAASAASVTEVTLRWFDRTKQQEAVFTPRNMPKVHSVGRYFPPSFRAFGNPKREK